ncbi:type II and III secretion system protein family protein [Oxalobacteraceae bacterium A2-2]
MLMLSAGFAGARVTATAPAGVPAEADPIQEIELYAGESRLISAPGLARIAVGNGQVITANAIDDKEVLIFAHGGGSTSLFIWDHDGHLKRTKVSVLQLDIGRYARDIAAFLAGIPNAKASVVGDKVVVEGDELSDADRDKVAELAKRYPQIINFTSPVGWEQMVMMDVRVVEFPKTELRELGLKWSATGGAAIGGVWAPLRRGTAGAYGIDIQEGGSARPPVTTPQAAGSVAPPSGLALLSALNLGLNAQLLALEQQGSASVLAEPQLSTRSGYKATFLAGGEIPYSVASVNGVTVQFKPYGIRLDIEPRVGNNGIIRAVIDSEVSTIDSSLTTANGPALLTRRTKTEFNVRKGETIVLAGLLQRTQSSDVDKVPLLGDLPVLGPLFRSRRYQNKETELVVFVTPSIVDSRTASLAQRVERTSERLRRQLGAPPHLSNPLQPAPDTNEVQP